MLDVNLIRKNPEEVKRGIASKNAKESLVDDFLKLDVEWREQVKAIDEKRAELRKLSTRKLEGAELEQAKRIKEQVKNEEVKLPDIEKKRATILKQIPNPPLPNVPVGKDESGNQTLREVGKKPSFNFPFKDYVELGEDLDLIDTERAGKVSGTRFGYLKREAAILEFGLAQMVIDFVTNEKNIKKIIKREKLALEPRAFIPIVPPVLIKPESMEAMGYVERGGDEIYFIEKDQLYLVGTSEQSIGPMHSGEVFEKKQLPLRYVGFSTCFRREAGSHGKDTRGILRVHQFDKLEMFTICAPENSADEHKLLLAIEEQLMQMLGLPYRVLNICTGDLGDPAAAKYDIEVWLPGQNDKKGQYRETHSTSNTTDYQARRLNIKMKPDNQFVHMLNGTAFAIGRILIAILENYQTKDGSVKVPKILKKYTGLKEIRR